MMSFRLGHGVCGWPTGFYWQRSPLGTNWVFKLTGTGTGWDWRAKGVLGGLVVTVTERESLSLSH